VAIGLAAGASNQSGNGIAIGIYSGNSDQGIEAIAIGPNAGQTTQGNAAVAIGNGAGYTLQTSNAIAIGYLTAQNNQSNDSIAIGTLAAQDNQAEYAISIGYQSGLSNQGCNAICMGKSSGKYFQGQFAISMGHNAGFSNQGIGAISIGVDSAQDNQNVNSIAIGNSAGQINQSQLSIGLGAQAAQFNQAPFAVAIGPGAGNLDQKDYSVAVGLYAGGIYQSSYCVAVGNYAGYSNQGANSVAIGSYAGRYLQADNSIILNATGLELHASTSGFFVSPVDHVSSTTALNMLFYNSTTSEIVQVDPSTVTISPRLGNTLTVDSVNGNDLIAVPGGTPYRTVNAALSNLIPGDTMWVLPGLYQLTSSIHMPDNTSLRGMSLQTVKLVLSNVSSATTMLTMGENCRVEDLQLYLHSASNYDLVGIEFPGTTHYTAKLRTAVVTVDNSNASYTDSNNCYALHFTGSNNLGEQAFSFNSLKGSTVNLFSNGGGRKRAVLVSGNNVVVSTRDMNLYCAAPVDSNSTGSYVGIETSNATAAIQLRATTISGPSSHGSYSGSDILQTLGSIEIGPGTDIVHKSAGTSTFTTYVYPTVIYYGVKGDLSNAGVTSGYLWPGSMVAQQAQGRIAAYPDPVIAYYRVQQLSIMNSFTTYLTSGPQHAASTHLTVEVNGAETPFKIHYNSNESGFKVFSTASVDLKLGDLISLKLDLSSIATNLSHDLTVQLDLF
jgi:hypothetical protein